jgi:RNA polymerase sigma-70 factor (ECF subfamily)
MTASGARSVEELYAASYVRLVGVVGAITRDHHEAEEAVQEAFVRLLRHWPKVSGYEDPEAWVRGAALRLLSNRRRKAVNALRAAVRLGPPPTEPGPSPLTVDLARGLAALPRQQREAIVLHRLGLGPEQVAATLGIAVGTAKSRLSRARAALAPLLSEDLNDRV